MLKQSIPILMYHAVSAVEPGSFRKYVISPSVFRNQMKWLSAEHYRPISLDQLIAFREGRLKLSAKPVIITFDDGFLDCLDHAIPVLEEYHFPATFFIVAGLAGKRSEWIHPQGIDFALMDWPALRDLHSRGFECGSHTMTHPHLADIAPRECLQELLDSRLLLEDQLGSRIRHLAYPYGSFNDTVCDLAAQTGYETACTTVAGISSLANASLALPRVPICGAESMLDFAFRLSTASNAADYLRRSPSRLRQALGFLKENLTR